MGDAVVILEPLIGKKIQTIERRVSDTGDERIIFTLEGGEKYQLFHFQDCCESVTIEDICGDLKDLVGSPITQAEEVTGKAAQPDGCDVPADDEEQQWTFYKFATIQGFVTIRWGGYGNGYYSLAVDFEKIN